MSHGLAVARMALCKAAFSDLMLSYDSDTVRMTYVHPMLNHVKRT